MQKIHQNWLQEPIEGTSYEQVPTLICGSYAYCSFARSCDLGGGGCSLQNLIFSGTGCIFKLIDVAFITFIRNGIVAWMEAMFVCLFVCWDKTRKSMLRPDFLCWLLCWEGSKPHGSVHTRTEAQTTCVPKTASQTTYSSIYGYLISLKLTGWLAFLDLSQPYTRRILSHWKASPHSLFDVLGLEGGRGKTMNDLVDRDRELPTNLAQLNKTTIHTLPDPITGALHCLPGLGSKTQVSTTHQWQNEIWM